MTDILGSALLATLLSSIITYIMTRRQESLQYITSDRREWREKIREIAERLNGASYEDTKKALTELKVRINAYGSQGKRRKYEKDSHIWELIEEIEKGEPEKEKLQKMQSQMIRYISFLLKYDWERSKKEVKGNVFRVISIISNLIACGIFSFYYYQGCIQLNPEYSIEKIYMNIGIFVIIFIVTTFVLEWFYKKVVEKGVELPRKGRFRNFIVYSIICGLLFIMYMEISIWYMRVFSDGIIDESVKFMVVIIIFFGQGINCMSKIGKIQLETDYTCAIDEEREKFLRDSVPDTNQSVRENGVWNHNFDFSKEITMYSFLCEEGKKREKRKYRNLQGSEKFYTYAGWKAYIKNKYSCYPVEGLKEFSRYLNHKSRIYPSLRDYTSASVSAVVSAFLGAIVSKWIDENDTGIDSLIWNIFSGIFYVVAIFIVGIMVVSLVKMFIENRLKQNFYEDYMEIIDEIICEKIQKFECLHGMKCY